MTNDESLALALAAERAWRRRCRERGLVAELPDGYREVLVEVVREMVAGRVVEG